MIFLSISRERLGLGQLITIITTVIKDLSYRQDEKEYDSESITIPHQKCLKESLYVTI